MNWKGFGRKEPRPSWDTILIFAWGDWGKSWKLHQDSQCPGWDSNWAPLNTSVEYYFYSILLGAMSITVFTFQFFVRITLLKSWIILYVHIQSLSTHEVCSKSSWNLYISNIFLYLELIEYYPLQNSPLAQQCISPIAFSIFGSTVWRMFVLLASSHSSR
jgi:hypothetical protein